MRRTPRRPLRRPPHLGAKLEALAATYGGAYLPSDPIQFAHRYSAADDRETVAFLAAALAYGSVKQIGGSVQRALAFLETLSPSPARAVERLDPVRDLSAAGGFRHRFNDARDLVAMLGALGRIRREHGGIEAFFDEPALRGRPLRERVSSFSRRALGLVDRRLYGPATARGHAPLPDDAGVRFFFADPADGSACKRLCMFLRWVVRPADGVDLGLWRSLAPADLVMPLDTHTTRIGFANGLCPSPFATWRNAEHVTAALRRFDPGDPTRFDFALSRLGILRVKAADAGVRVARAGRS